MTEAEKKVESSAPEAQANSSESWWDKFTGKNATEAAKKKMEDILTLQKTELANVISEFKQGKTDIVGKSNQQKMELLAEVSKTINNLKNNRNINGIVNDNLSVTEDAYEKLEAKITGTKEVVDFKHPEFIEMAIANLEQFKQELSGASIESTQAEAGDVKESVHLSYGSNNNPSVSSNLYGNTSDDISQKLIDVKIANQEKKNKVDEFKTKSLDEIKQLNDEYITTYTESLKDKLNGATDAEMKKKIERLISSYMSVQELIKSTRTSSENSSESQKKEQEISIYENNLYALNKKTEQLLGTETIEKTIEEPIPAIITPVTSAPAVTVESIPDETLPPKDFYEHINFSKKKKDWPAKERELAIESIKKEVNSNDELADALSKLEYSSKWIKSGKKSSVHSIKDVLLVQLALTNLGYKPSILDGVYKDSKLGSETWVMVISFQRGLNTEAGKEVLKEDGQIGPKTLEKMIEALRGKDISAPIEKNEEKTSIPQVEEKPTPTSQDTTENISKTEGKMETIVIQEENPRKILTIGEINALSRTENQGKQQFEQELQKRNIKVTRDTSNGEYVGDSRIRWENSPYNPKSKTAEEYRFIALNNLFTAGGESTKEALNYMSEHPEDPAVVRLDTIIKEINASEQKSTEAPLVDDVEPIEALPVKEEEVTIPEVEKPIESPTPEVIPSVSTPIENTTPISKWVTLENFKALQLKAFDQISFETHTWTIRTGVYQIMSKTAVGTEIQFRDEYGLRSFYLEDMKPGTLKKTRK